MQLDLFLDNRRTILENAADEHLRNLELGQAVALYEKIRIEAPDDPAALSAKATIEAWQDLLEQFHSYPPGIDRIYQLYEHLSEPAPAALSAGLRAFFIGQLEKKQSPELIFIPPGFHIGCLLLETERPVEAEKWFALALDSGIPERGRFLARRGDALTMAGQTHDARECYLAAFLEDPAGVDLSRLVDEAVREMPGEIEEEGIAEDEALHWVPAWGWLKGIFSLDSTGRSPDQVLDYEFLTMEESSGKIPAPRLWFECLRYAERLRTGIRDDGELLRVRKKMKEMNHVMFGKYMKKIRASTDSAELLRQDRSR